MNMTDKQFNGFILFISDALLEVLDKMNDGEAKTKLQKVVDNLQGILED